MLVYDDDCRFCRLWIDYWKSLTGDRVTYVPYQNLWGEFPEIPTEDFRKSVHLITPGGEVFRGAEAVFRTLSFAPGGGWQLWIYEKVPGFSSISEIAYSLKASHRPLFYKITTILWGENIGPHSYILSRGCL